MYLAGMFFDKVLSLNIPYMYVLTYYYYIPIILHWARPIYQYNTG